MMSAINCREIDVVILCGGLGERLQEVIKDRPKPMAKINRRPFLDILIGYVASYGFRRFILCIGYGGNVIKQHYQKREGPLTILFSEEQEPLGTGGAIKNAEPLIRSNPFLVMNGDSFCQVNLREFVDFHINKKALLSIVLGNATNSKDYGVIALGDSQRIVKFDEKARAESQSFINAGIYLFDANVLSLMPSGKNFSLEHGLFPKIIDGGFFGYVTQGNFVDIGTPEKYEKAKQLLANTRNHL